MRKILTGLLDFLAMMLSIAGNCILEIFELLSEDRKFRAAWGKIANLASRWNKGFVISGSAKLTRKKSFESLLIVGGTGSGKTSSLLIPTILTLRGCSIFIHDPSKELFEKCSGYLSKYFDIVVFNFSDASKSMGYNLLRRTQRMNDVQKLSDQLSRASLESASNDPFWLIKTKECLSILIRLTLYQPERYRNMANVLYLLNILISDPEMIDHLIAKTDDNKLILDYKSLIAQSDKVLQSVLSSAKAALQIFDDDEVAKVTSRHSFDFERLRKKPTVVFLHNSIANQAYYSVLNSLVFQQFYEFILESLPQRGDLDLFVILEELSSLNLGKLLPLALANCRKYSVGTICALQNQKQLEPYYGKDAETIVNNCITKIYMPGLSSIDELRYLEAIAGKFTYNDKKDGNSEKTRPLLTIDEARLLKRTLILHSNHPIIKGRLQPYYKNRAYRRFCSMPPALIADTVINQPIPLVPDPRKEVLA